MSSSPVPTEPEVEEVSPPVSPLPPAPRKVDSLDPHEKKEAPPAAATEPAKTLADDLVNARLLRLNCKEGKSYTVMRTHAFISNLIKTGLENDDAADEFPVPGVSSHVLEHVVMYLSHHKGTEPALIEKPLRSKVMRDVCSDKWDAEFIDRIGEVRQLLYDLILAANYMDIKGLLHLGCAKVASLIKGQPLEKIKEILDPKLGMEKLPAGYKSVAKEAPKEADVLKAPEVAKAPEGQVAKVPEVVAKKEVQVDKTPSKEKRKEDDDDGGSATKAPVPTPVPPRAEVAAPVAAAAAVAAAVIPAAPASESKKKKNNKGKRRR